MGSTAASGPITLATVEVSGAGRPAGPLPTALPAPRLPTEPASMQRTLTFAMQMGMGSGAMMSFTIDGKMFDPQRIDQSVQLGSTEEWLVSNTSSMAHPFHLHVWPFQVLATNDNPIADQTLRDVVLVPPRGWARLRIQFADFTGRSVYHCHILDHEDAGMMATIQSNQP
jgi:FtsP/CotA-like multicopper oxidase with cupredoxin domain